MSVQSALRFITQVRQDDGLRHAVGALRTESASADAMEETMDRLLAVATAAGFEVTAADLQSAFRHDWVMRRARFDASR